MDKKKTLTVADHLRTAFEFTNRMAVRGEAVDILCVIRNELRIAIQSLSEQEEKNDG